MILDMVVTRVFVDVSKNLKRVNILRGGSRSGKSHALMQLVYVWLMSGRIGKHHIPKGNWLIIRETMPALRSTVLREWIDYLINQKVYNRIDNRKTTHTFTYHNRTIEFFSMDNPEKLKGRQSTFFWLNEANSIPFDAFMSLLMRCEKFSFADVNPNDPESWIKLRIEDDRLLNRGDVNLDISTYKDNPYLNPEMIEEIEGLKAVDFELYQVYTLGKWTKLSGKILTNWEIIEEIDFPTDLKVGYGLDFGFTNDPTALIRICYDKLDNILYCHQVIYQTELLNSDIVDIIKEECAKNEPIVADSAEPKSIRELQIAGIRCIPAIKGKDSVKHGLQKLRQVKIMVTNTSYDMIKELQRYKWQVDSLGKATNKPIDAYDHAISATRYYFSLSIIKIKVS